MKHETIVELEDQYQIPTYSKLPIAIERGSGPYVWDAEGNRYLDFYGGHCVSILGHTPAAVVRAISEQAGELLFYSNIVYNSKRARAAELVANTAPEGLNRVFFCNSGAEANETALKIARKATGRSTILAMEGAFHGRTLGSLSVTHGDKYRKAYESILAPVVFVPFGDGDAVEHALNRNPDIAAVILEPIQSMAGMRTAPTEYFKQLEAACETQGALLILDEVQTGVGRVGSFSYSEIVGIKPSIITLAKSLGSGVPVGAAVVTTEVADTIEVGDQGSTFGGGMLAMAAVAATLETIRDENLAENALSIEKSIRTALEPFAVAMRGAGCLLGLDLGYAAAPVVRALRQNGLLVGGSSDPHTIRLMPPVNSTESDVAEALEIFQSTLAESSSKINVLA